MRPPRSTLFLHDALPISFSDEIAEIVNIFAWRGKTFDGKRGELTNRITPFGLNAIVAEIYKDKSWLDGKECIRSEEHTSELQSQFHLVCRLLLEKKKSTS